MNGDIVYEEKSPVNEGNRRDVFENLKSTTEYVVGISSICEDLQKMIKAESETREKIIVAFPKPPTNLISESLQSALLKIKWDPPTDLDACNQCCQS